MIKCLFGFHEYGGEKFQINTHHSRCREYFLQLCSCGYYGQVTRLVDEAVMMSGPIEGKTNEFDVNPDTIFYGLSGWIFGKVFLERYPKLHQLFKDIEKQKRRRDGAKM